MADLSEVLTVWEGLGYYSRARNLHQASREIVARFKGRIPDNLDDLLSLPGIGRYTAGAILSIAYNKEVPVLDGNVRRVFSRLFAIPNDGANSKTEIFPAHFLETLIPNGHACSFNQSLMDLGSMICTPKGPRCRHCPIIQYCKAKAQGNPEKYPIRQAKKKIPHRYAVAATIRRHGKILLIRRPPKGLLGGLWEFPNWEVDSGNDPGKQLARQIRRETGLRVKSKEPVDCLFQTFSHFKLTLHVYQCETEGRSSRGAWAPLTRLSGFPMPRLHRKIANSLSPA